MITIPIWLFIVFSFLSVVGAMSILMVIFTFIRIRHHENKIDFNISKEMEEIWDTKTNKEN